MNPSRLRETGQIHRNDGTVQFYHVLLQFGKVTLTVPPVQISLTVIINKDSRIDIIPITVAALSSHVIGDKGRATSIHKRPGRRIGNSDTDGLTGNSTMLHSHIPIKLAITFYDLACPCLTFCPRKIFCFQRRRVFRPCLQV